MKKIHLLLIDPQNDFCDPTGSLAVKGADADMARLAKMIDRLGGKIDDVHVTLDSHRVIDIAHPKMFKRVSDGQPPTPFTVLGVNSQDRIVRFDNGQPTSEEYITFLPSHRVRVVQYLKALTAGGRYPHVIWPEHCLIGTWGTQVYKPVSDSLINWERQNFAIVDYVTKGSNPWTEHFSGVKAEVPDPSDPSTQINTALIQTLESADEILLAGEARSHCLANTVRDIVGAFSDPSYVKKLILLTDATSDVPGFEQYGESFVQDMVKLGMKTTTTVDYLK